VRLLFDENLSPCLADRMADAFPGSAHGRDLGLVGQPDGEIWNGRGATAS
jgi:predicted nuclease of predicted toxin-antitoxin system